MLKRISIFLILLVAFYVLVISLLCLQSKIGYYKCSDKISETANKICKYKFSQGQWPSSLEELVPQYLSEKNLSTLKEVRLEYETHPYVSINANCPHGHNILRLLSFGFFSPIADHGVDLDIRFNDLYTKEALDNYSLKRPAVASRLLQGNSSAALPVA
ncbi:MAG: hypothetical protein AB1756_06680 [Acidobacteriota bacterium]